MRLALLVVCTLSLLATGCAGVPAAVVWTTVGSGLGFGAAVVTLDTEILKDVVAEKTVTANTEAGKK